MSWKKGMRVGYDQDLLYTCMKSSKNKQNQRKNVLTSEGPTMRADTDFLTEIVEAGE